MNDNIVRVGNTPIFEKLVAERGYDPKCTGRRYSDVSDYLGQLNRVRPSGMVLPGSWIAKPVPVLQPMMDYVVHDHIDMSMGEEAMRTFIKDREEEFLQQRPHLREIKSSVEYDVGDNSHSLVIEGRGEKITPKYNAELRVNFHPLDLEGHHTTVEDFITARQDEFNRKHPNAVAVEMLSMDELDGTTTLVIRGHENKGIDLVKKPAWLKERWKRSQQPQGETFMVRGETAVLPPVFRTDPMPEDLAAQQLHFYKKHLIDGDIPTKLDTEETPDVTLAETVREAVEGYLTVVRERQKRHAQENDEESNPEQTDESVNAASTDVQPRPQDAGPRPLWFVDEENADEE